VQVTNHGPTANRLLAALPEKDLTHLLASCESVDLIFAEVLHEQGDRIRHVYFPTGGFVSLVAPIQGYAGLEVGLVGIEGMLGTSLILGVDPAPLHALVQGEGSALRLKAASFRRHLEDSVPLQQGLNRYLFVLMSQLAQMAACARFHVLEARLARWLLMTHDRARSDQFHLTHEFLSHMLGVRRVGVTKAAGELQRRKLISYNRGAITVLDRSKLEAAACGCYLADNEVYNRILA
jgi:CRP-like cAMP-binding protein